MYTMMTAHVATAHRPTVETRLLVREDDLNEDHARLALDLTTEQMIEELVDIFRRRRHERAWFRRIVAQGQSAPTTVKVWLTKIWCGQLTPM